MSLGGERLNKYQSSKRSPVLDGEGVEQAVEMLRNTCISGSEIDN